jgi:hypothetical protein
MASAVGDGYGGTKDGGGYLRGANGNEGTAPESGKIRRFELLETSVEGTGLEIISKVRRQL